MVTLHLQFDQFATKILSAQRKIEDCHWVCGKREGIDNALYIEAYLGH